MIFDVAFVNLNPIISNIQQITKLFLAILSHYMDAKSFINVIIFPDMP